MTHDEAQNYLRKLHTGQKIYGIVHTPSPKRQVQLLVAISGGIIEDITSKVSQACDVPLRAHGILVRGGNFCAVHAIVEWLEEALHVNLTHEQLSTNFK